MTEMDIMVFIYENQKNENWVDINSLFLKEFPHPTKSTYAHITSLITRLVKHEFIDLIDRLYASLGNQVPIYPPEYPNYNQVLLSFEEIDKRRKQEKEKGSNYGILAKLKFDGRKEVENFLFQKQLRQVNQSVIDTNSFSKTVKNAVIASAFIAGITGLFIALQFFKDASPNLQPINTQLEQQTKILDSMRQVQKEIGSSLKTMVKLDSLKTSKTP